VEFVALIADVDRDFCLNSIMGLSSFSAGAEENDSLSGQSSCQCQR